MQFELPLTTTELPDWDEFITFLQKHCLVLENLQSNLNMKPKQFSCERKKNCS